MRYLKPADRVSLIVDGANLYGAAKGLGISIDYRLLLNHVATLGNLREARYFTMALENADEYNPLTPMLDWIEYNGFLVTTKPPMDKRSSIVPEMTVAMMRAASYCDVFLLMSGDGEMCAAVDAVQDLGKPVIVISTLEPRAVSDDLRRAAAEFKELADWKGIIGRPPAAPKG